MMPKILKRYLVAPNEAKFQENFVTLGNYLSPKTMKLRHYLLAFALLILGGCATQGIKQQADAGKLDIYEEFATELIPTRTVYVWTPEGYNPEIRYAVLYMHDGQMLFDEETSWNGQSWNVDAVAQRLQDEGKCRPFIVVGIDNHPTNRLTEYTPAKMLNYLDPNDKLLNKFDRAEFIADSYLSFIVEELKPFVDSHYSTQKQKQSQNN